MDPVSSVERIVKLALAIKNAADTARQNKELCQEIRTRVARVSALLSLMPEQSAAALMEEPAMRGALEDLESSLQRALELVAACQAERACLLLCTAGKRSRQLRRAQDDISHNVMTVIFATNVQVTVVLTRNPPPPYRTDINESEDLPPPPAYFVGRPVARCDAPKSSLTRFNFSDLDIATSHFSDGNLIGRGTFADVYKGERLHGVVLAVKKFHQPFQFSVSLIQDRINIFSEFKQQNVVRFIGYAFEERSCILVEEYMSGGSLDNIIWSPHGWSSFFQIIRGRACGLHYLHNQNFIHLDLKPGNVLLNSYMNPNITNIGTATILSQGDDDTIRDVSTVAGTLGYMASEYITGGTLSTKCDVYGFGVIFLEIICNMCNSQPTRGHASIEWAWVARSTKLSFDPSLYEGSQLNDINRCIEIGLLCTQFKPEDRPTMSDVLEMINGKKKLPKQKKPRYIKGRS